MNPTSKQFGLVIAYLLPGFIGLAGIAPFSPVVAAWLHPVTYAEASLGPPVYVLIAAVTVGMIASVFRWLLIDHVHAWMGVIAPRWDDNRLGQRLGAFDYLVDSHYRYYQFVANSLVAIVGAYALNRSMSTLPSFGLITDVGVFLLCAALFAGSRDALSKYYSRTGQLVGQIAEKGPEVHTMFNGNHQATEGGASQQPSPAVKPQTKPETSPKPEPDKSKSTLLQK